MRRPLDTSIDGRERQLELYRAMTAEDRVRLADQMSTEVRELARAGIRARMPDGATVAEVEAELVRTLVGPNAGAGAQARRAPASR